MFMNELISTFAFSFQFLGHTKSQPFDFFMKQNQPQISSTYFMYMILMYINDKICM